MNKKELVDTIAERVGDKKTATEAVNAVLDAIQSAVATGDKVSITGFGAFEMVHKPARTARNPSTGAEINVAESWAPKFRPGSDFKELVNTGGKKAAKKK
jgi:DNA-binding protein HU-beta